MPSRLAGVWFRLRYQSRPYFAWINRCWRCLINPYHD